MDCEKDTLPKLSSGTIFNDLERLLSQISRSRHHLTLNVLETVRDTHIVTMECTKTDLAYLVKCALALSLIRLWSTYIVQLPGNS